MSELVNLVISSNISEYGNERRFPRKMLVSELKVFMYVTDYKFTVHFNFSLTMAHYC